MLGWSVTFFFVSLVSGAFGFGGLSAVFAGALQILFFTFVILFLATLSAHLLSGRRTA